ncbi:MAG: DNA polymerase domain-containing protein [Alphaproteobacteria bacterium]|nr:DNA polymerase domain-containing protein [Alphaproteobacteria bacterium]
MAKAIELDAAGRTVRISNPDKVWFPEAGLTKLDVVRYYQAVAPGALRGVAGRPMQMERYVDGADKPPFYQKRAPDKGRPDWVETVVLRFPSMRTAEEVVVRDEAQLLWVVNLGCLSLHPHPVRAEDLDHPDELRIDLDPVPGVDFELVKEVATGAREVLDEHGLRSWPKTSGSRGIHLLVRIEPRWTFPDVRRAALAVAREVERRMPGRATARWWKEERVGVFLDYNQNAKDRTVASAYSVRAKPDARVSTPFRWEELPGLAPETWTLRTVPDRFAAEGDPHEEIDAHAGRLDSLLALADEQGPSEGDPPAKLPKGKSTGRREPTRPLLVIGESEDESAALEGLERWKARWPEVTALLEPKDVLVDKQRGRYRTWTRIRVNLESVPVDRRPPQEALDPDDAPRRWGPPHE